MKGIDYLGLGHKLFPISDVLEITPKGYALGCFDQTFGNVLPALKTLLKSRKFPVVRVHLAWSDHKINPLDLIRKRSAVYQDISLLFPYVKFYLSHSCEYKPYDKNQAEKRIRVIKRFAPNCIPVDCPLYQCMQPGVIGEFHSDKEVARGKPFIVSQDGQGQGARGAWKIDNGRWSKLYKAAEIRFFWVPELNLRSGDAPAPPPKLRKKPPTKAELERLISYTYE